MSFGKRIHVDMKEYKDIVNRFCTVAPATVGMLGTFCDPGAIEMFINVLSSSGGQCLE